MGQDAAMQARRRSRASTNALSAASADQPAPPPNACRPGRLLLVTAHPDDEALFFAPALLGMRQAGSPFMGVEAVDVLCLSTGDAAGLGKVRAQELAAAWPALLGRRAAGTVTVVDHPGLQDGLHTAWDVGAAAAAIMAAVTASAPAACLSFDGRGVTGHPNHAAAAAALAACGPALAGRGVAAWHLRSLPAWLAWLGPLALVAVPSLERRRRRCGGASSGGSAVLTLRAGPAAVVRGLDAHASQRIWWRVAGAVVRSASYVSVLDLWTPCG